MFDCKPPRYWCLLSANFCALVQIILLYPITNIYFFIIFIIIHVESCFGWFIVMLARGVDGQEVADFFATGLTTLKQAPYVYVTAITRYHNYTRRNGANSTSSILGTVTRWSFIAELCFFGGSVTTGPMPQIELLPVGPPLRAGPPRGSSMLWNGEASVKFGTTKNQKPSTLRTNLIIWTAATGFCQKSNTSWLDFILRAFLCIKFLIAERQFSCL